MRISVPAGATGGCRPHMCGRRLVASRALLTGNSLMESGPHLTASHSGSQRLVQPLPATACLPVGAVYRPVVNARECHISSRTS
jgi:hypothetical protein